MKLNTLEVPTQVQNLIDTGALFVINHSGGKDSQVMALHLAGIIPAEQVLVIHAELPEADWDGIQSHIEATVPTSWLDRIVYTKAAKTFFDMVERRFESRPNVPSFPSPKHRQCTSDLKRDPISKVVRHFVKANPQFTNVVHCIGIRAEESSSRAKAKTWKANKRETLQDGTRNVWEWLPIHDMTEVEVRRDVAEAGQELHWAYGAGMTRLSCAFCIMGSKADMKTAARLNPELAARYIALEVKTGYTMSMSEIPLEVIIRS